MIDFCQVSYTYLKKSPLSVRALSEVSWSSGRSKAIALLGRTGSGKSTLIQLTNGILLPTKGSVTVDGLDTRKTKHKKIIREKVGVSFQLPEKQFCNETVYDEIAFGLESMRWDEDRKRDQVRRIADLFCIPHSMMSRSPYQLSGGEKRLVGLASVLVRDPSYIFLDEPTVNLDCSSVKRIQSVIQSLIQQEKKVICITHDIESATALFDRWLVLFNGQIVFDGDPSQYPLFSEDAKKHGIYPTRFQRLIRAFPGAASIH